MDDPRAVRDSAGRDPMASAGIVDAQSVKGADTVGRDSRGYDSGNHAGRVVMPSIALVWADGGYAGMCVEFARRLLRITLTIVKKPDGQRGLQVLPRRWVVERTLSWLTRCRRLDRDHERLPEHAEAMVKWAMIGLMTRRLAPGPGRRPWQPAKAS